MSKFGFGLKFLTALLLLANSIALTHGAAAAGAEQPWQNWSNSLGAKHKLSGRIWSAQRGGFVEPDMMADDLAAGTYVLLGEIHDNADHHRLQAWVIDQLARRGRKPAIVMEMIDVGQDKALKAYMGSDKPDAAGLGAALGWASSGWPAWELYQPIAAALFKAGLALDWANDTREMIRKIGREGFSALKPERIKALKLDQNLPDALEADLRSQIVAAHCNLLPASAAGPMVNVQRYRDALFAERMMLAGQKGGAVLIAGGGHVRADRAVPYYLKAQDGKAVIKTLILAETIADRDKPEDYGPRTPDGTLAADYIWFTPRAERPDPCEGLKKHLNKKRETKAKKP